MGEFEIRKFKNSQRRFVRTIWGKIWDKFQNFWLHFVGGVGSVLPKFYSHRVPYVNENDQNSLNFNFQNFKSSKRSFVRTIRKKNRSSVLLKFSLLFGPMLTKTRFCTKKWKIWNQNE